MEAAWRGAVGRFGSLLCTRHWEEEVFSNKCKEVRMLSLEQRFSFSFKRQGLFNTLSIRKKQYMPFCPPRSLRMHRKGSWHPKARRHVPPGGTRALFVLLRGGWAWFWSQSAKGGRRGSPDSDCGTHSALRASACRLASVLRVPHPEQSGAQKPVQRARLRVSSTANSPRSTQGARRKPPREKEEASLRKF